MAQKSDYTQEAWQRELARNRQYKKEHHTEIRAYEQKYRIENPDIIKAIRKREYEKNKTRYKQYHKSYREQNWDRLAEAKEYYYNNYYSLETEALFQYTMDLLTGSQIHGCQSCSERDLRCLQLDHIKGGGSRNRINNRSLYIWIINHPIEAKETFQILCANCNWKKRFVNNECKSKEVTV